MLHNIDDHRSIASVRVAEWKLSRGSSSGGQWDSWYGPSGREPGLAYDVDAGWNVKKHDNICSLSAQSIGKSVWNDEIQFLVITYRTRLKGAS